MAFCAMRMTGRWRAGQEQVKWSDGWVQGSDPVLLRAAARWWCSLAVEISSTAAAGVGPEDGSRTTALGSW
jgi:hypothetical protein